MKFLKDNVQIIAIVIFVLMFLATCSSNKSTKRELVKVQDELVIQDSLHRTDIDKIILVMKLENLKSEKRSVLNINQIFLTKKRPDERVLEIDGEIEVIEKELEKY